MEIPNESTVVEAMKIHDGETKEKRLMLALMCAASFAVDDGASIPGFRRMADAAFKWARARRDSRADEVRRALDEERRALNAGERQ